MNTIIDLDSELLIDLTSLNDPFLRLLVKALGKNVLDGSAWVSIDKDDLGPFDPQCEPRQRQPMCHCRTNSCL